MKGRPLIWSIHNQCYWICRHYRSGIKNLPLAPHGRIYLLPSFPRVPPPFMPRFPTTPGLSESLPELPQSSSSGKGGYELGRSFFAAGSFLSPPSLVAFFQGADSRGFSCFCAGPHGQRVLQFWHTVGQSFKTICRSVSKSSLSGCFTNSDRRFKSPSLISSSCDSLWGSSGGAVGIISVSFLLFSSSRHSLVDSTIGANMVGMVINRLESPGL